MARLGDVVERDVGRLARETADAIAENRAGVASALAASERTLNALTHVSDRLTTFIGPLVADSDLAHMTHDLRGALDAVERGGAELSLTMAENRERLRQALSQFAAVVSELHGLAREIRSSPSALVWGRNPVERAIPDPRPK
jgi:ABC-type transporter Mla subunit MlaD